MAGYPGRVQPNGASRTLAPTVAARRRGARALGAGLVLLTVVGPATRTTDPGKGSARVVVTAALRADALTSTPDDPYLSQQWGLRAIGAPSAWAAATGAGVTVAVVDTGVDLGHPDLVTQLVPGINLVDPGQAPDDDNGHGTALAGIIAASTDNGIGVAGVAPDARIMPVKALDADGRGAASTVDAGVEWAAAHGARVINLSFGDLLPGDLPPGLQQAVAQAWSEGAICVLAAGNDPTAIDSYPEADAVVVGAVTQAGSPAAYSSSVGGAPWALSAPGGDGTTSGGSIISTYWTPGAGPTYASLAGTSMATAFVSGALADLLSLGLTPRVAVQRLLAAATPLGDPVRSGAGALDLAAAVRASVTLAGTAAGTIVAPARTSTAAPTRAPSPRAKTPQFSATAAGDTAAGDTGAADTGAGDTGAADTGAADTGAADTGAADTGARDTGTGDRPTAGHPADRTRRSAQGPLPGAAGAGPLRPRQGGGLLIVAAAGALLVGAAGALTRTLRLGGSPQPPLSTRTRTR